MALRDRVLAVATFLAALFTALFAASVVVAATESFFPSGPRPVLASIRT